MSSIEVQVIETKKNKYINYCYVVIDRVSNDALMIDPAWEKDKFEFVLQKESPRIKGIFLTHHHFDHINLGEYFSNNYNVPVLMSKKEVDTYGYNAKKLFTINESSSILIGTMEVNCLLTPGHTAGSMCYLIGNNLFTGDTLFNEGCGICADNFSSSHDLYCSLQRIKKTVNDDTKLYPGHIYKYPVGLSFRIVNKINIYMRVDDENTFITLRKNFQSDRISKKAINFI